MLTVLVPMMEKNEFFDQTKYQLPLSMIEVAGETILEKAVKSLQTLTEKIKFVFVVDATTCKRFHIDDSIKMLLRNNVEVIVHDGATHGALCTCLLAIEHIDNETPLVVSNVDQFFKIKLDDYYKSFLDYDGGVLTFDSVQPRWAYALTDNSHFVKEVAEKRPISRDAIAGLIYFKSGKFFIECAKSAIRKNNRVFDKFYTSAALNEAILNGDNVKMLRIDSTDYISFYSQHKMEEYSSLVVRKTNV